MVPGDVGGKETTKPNRLARRVVRATCLRQANFLKEARGSFNNEQADKERERKAEAEREMTSMNEWSENSK